MVLSQEQRGGLGVALNEATLLGFELDPARRLAAATLSVLTLPESGPAPEDPRVQLLLRSVGRLAASLRNAAWNDPDAEPVPLAVDDLLATVQSFGGLPVYGWEFIDVHEKAMREWGHRLSLDWTAGAGGLTHSITLFQEAHDRILDLCVWFDEVELRTPDGKEIPLDALIAGGRRWWDGLYAGDERTEGQGIFPMNGSDG